VRVTGDDYERLGPAVDALVHFVGNRAYMRLSDGHCAALRIEVDGRFVCDVYDVRPDACRDLERASPQCAGELFTKAGRAEAKLVELRRLVRSAETFYDGEDATTKPSVAVAPRGRQPGGQRGG